MLLRVSILFLFSAFSFQLFANDSTQTWNQWKKDWVKKEIRFKHIHVKKDKNLIGDIEVLDIRSDTERVGIYTNDSHRPGELVFDTSLQFLINAKLSNKASSNNLLLVIRSFWINEIQNFKGGTGINAGDGHRAPLTQLKCSIDAFIKQDEKYIPLTQCDTIVTDKNNVAFACHNITEEALAALQRKLEEALSLNFYTGKKTTTRENIVRAYSKRFLIAAITDTSCKKGIYYTWEQFRDNQPVCKEFSIKQNSKKEPPSLFTTGERGNEILTRNVFAVTDGNKVYKVHQGFVFPIYKHKNAIYFTGLEKFDLKTQAIPVGYPLAGGWARVGFEPVGSVMRIRLTPYLLNIETGEEY